MSELGFGALRGGGFTPEVRRMPPATLGPRRYAAYFVVAWSGGTFHDCGHRHSSHLKASRCMERLLGMAPK